MSLLEYLDQLNRNSHEEEQIETKDQRKPPFEPNTPVVALDNYLIEARNDCADNRLAYNLTTGEHLSARLYDHKTFHTKAHLLLAGVAGVCNVRDVKTTSDGVLVFTTRAYGDLHQYLRQKKRLNEAQAAQLFRQIVELVADAHRRKIALRDIKLKKFVFTDETSTSLALAHLDDAQLMDATGLLTDKHGCPAYICPEKLQSESYSGKAADLWSLGVILYTLLVGNYPFFDSTPQELFTKVRTGHYQVPEHVSYEARSLISSLLTYDPLDRVPAVAVLEHPWFSRALVEQPRGMVLSRFDQTVPAFVK